VELAQQMTLFDQAQLMAVSREDFLSKVCIENMEFVYVLLIITE
jgi:hypothetical protein